MADPIPRPTRLVLRLESLPNGAIQVLANEAGEAASSCIVPRDEWASIERRVTEAQHRLAHAERPSEADHGLAEKAIAESLGGLFQSGRIAARLRSVLDRAGREGTLLVLGIDADDTAKHLPFELLSLSPEAPVALERSEEALVVRLLEDVEPRLKAPALGRVLFWCADRNDRHLAGVREAILSVVGAGPGFRELADLSELDGPDHDGGVLLHVLCRGVARGDEVLLELPGIEAQLGHLLERTSKHAFSAVLLQVCHGGSPVAGAIRIPAQALAGCRIAILVAPTSVLSCEAAIAFNGAFYGKLHDGACLASSIHGGRQALRTLCSRYPGDRWYGFRVWTADLSTLETKLEYTPISVRTLEPESVRPLFDSRSVLEAASGNPDPQGRSTELGMGQVVERYTVEGRLGEGGMAVVYRVRHNTLGTLHALKVLTIANERIRRRLILEGRLQARLDHPNVLPVTDILDVQGVPGLLMKLVEGPTLERWLQDHHPDAETARRVFLGILSGVECAHSMGIVHRDLKPSNVLLEGATLVPQISDFGIAQAIQSDDGQKLTSTGAIMGTPGYMAPEQFMDAGGADHRADIFALGCILYELLTGRRAFSGKAPWAVYGQMLQVDFRSSDFMTVGLSEPMIRAIQACMAPDRENRLGSCAQLRSMLDDPSIWNSVGAAGQASVLGMEPTLDAPDASKAISLGDSPVEASAVRHDKASVERTPLPVASRKTPPAWLKWALVLGSLCVAALLAVLFGRDAVIVPPVATNPSILVVHYDRDRKAFGSPASDEICTMRRFLSEKVLPAVLARHPKAVFLDFAFEADCEDVLPSMQTVLKDAAVKGVPVMAAYPTRISATVPRPCREKDDVGCFSALVNVFATPDTRSGRIEKVEWCRGGQVTPGYALASILLDGTISTACKGEAQAVPPVSPLPYARVQLSEIIGGDSPIEDWSAKVVLVGDPYLHGQMDLRDVGDSKGVDSRLSGTEVHALATVAFTAEMQRRRGSQ